MKLLTSDPGLQKALALLQVHAPLYSELPDISINRLPADGNRIGWERSDNCLAIHADSLSDCLFLLKRALTLPDIRISVTVGAGILCASRKKWTILQMRWASSWYPASRPWPISAPLSAGDTWNPCGTVDNLMVGHEDTVELVEAMIAHFSKTFRSRRIHLGMGEAVSLGTGRYLRHRGYRHHRKIIMEHPETAAKQAAGLKVIKAFLKEDLNDGLSSLITAS